MGWFDDNGNRTTGGEPTSNTMPIKAPTPIGSTLSGNPQGFNQDALNALLAGVDKNNWAAGLKAIEPQLNAIGVQLQKNSAGEVRGRLYLPNEGGDPYGKPFDPFQGQGWVTPGGEAGGVAGPGGGGAQGQMQTELEMAPGFQFRLAEGQKAIERSAAAKGTLLTGGTLKDLTRYAQNFASNEYQNRYNQLYGLSALGLNAAGQSGSQYSNQANTGTNLITGGANAGAAGTIGQSNAINQGLQGAANQGIQAYWMWLLNQGGAGGGTPGGGYGPGGSYPGPTP